MLKSNNKIPKYEYILTKELKAVLQKPQGQIITNDKISYNTIIHMINTYNKIITVGDKTTEKLLSLGLIPQIQIIDGKEMRIERKLPVSKVRTQYKAINPPGHISKDSLVTLSLAFKSEQPVRIIVDGEEDLLVLPAIILATHHTYVIYGQPLQGLVIIKVNENSKNMAISFINKMIMK